MFNQPFYNVRLEWDIQPINYRFNLPKFVTERDCVKLNSLKVVKRLKRIQIISWTLNLNCNNVMITTN